MVRLQTKKGLSKQAKAYNRVVEDSFCTIQKLSTKTETCGLWIEFAGIAARLPSISNSKRAFMPKGARFPIITHSAENKGRMAAMTDLYLEALLKEGSPLISFGNTPIHVLVLLADRPSRWDSHNFSKTIGDWLTAVGVTDDDKYAEIHCFKKSDYGDAVGPPGTTAIVIQPRSQTTPLSRSFIAEIRRASAGFKYIG